MQEGTGHPDLAELVLVGAPGGPLILGHDGAGLAISPGLDLAFADTGDGPAFFVMSFVGIVVVALALWAEFTYEPPIWLHLVMWTVLSIVMSLLMVRPLKGVLVNLQYHHKAEEGRFEK